MSWTVRIFTSLDRQGREWHEILAISSTPVPDGMCGHQVGLVCDRDRALKLARAFSEEHGVPLFRADVIPFPERGRAA